MSRSYRKSTYSGITCAKSEKSWKKEWHSRMRARERDKLGKIGLYSDVYDPYLEVFDRDTQEVVEIPIMEHPLYGGQDYLTTLVLDISNVWDGPKDGRHYFSLKKMYKFYNSWPEYLKRRGGIKRIMHKLVAK